MKELKDLTFREIEKMVSDLHALMWKGDGCEVCANCVVVHREPYYKTDCILKECDPLWRGFEDHPERGVDDAET